jgi:hypothetical protein
VFLWIGKVYLDFEFIEHCIHKQSKLVVASDFCDVESGFVVDLKNIFDSFSVVGHCLLVDELSSLVVYVLGDGCQESESVDLDSINAEDHLVLLCEKFLWDVDVVIDNGS